MESSPPIATSGLYQDYAAQQWRACDTVPRTQQQPHAERWVPAPAGHEATCWGGLPERGGGGELTAAPRVGRDQLPDWATLPTGRGAGREEASWGEAPAAPWRAGAASQHALLGGPRRPALSAAAAATQATSPRSFGDSFDMLGKGLADTMVGGLSQTLDAGLKARGLSQTFDAGFGFEYKDPSRFDLANPFE